MTLLSRHNALRAAVFGGDASALVDAERHLSAVEANLGLARGRVVQARFLAAMSRTPPDPDDVADELVLFERARQLYRDLGDVRGEAEAQSGSARFTRWCGTMMPSRFLPSSRPAPSRPKPTIP